MEGQPRSVLDGMKGLETQSKDAPAKAPSWAPTIAWDHVSDCRECGSPIYSKPSPGNEEPPMVRYTCRPSCSMAKQSANVVTSVMPPAS